MTIILLLIPIVLALGLIGLAAFVWTVRSGQYRDLDGDRYRILEDDSKPLSREEARRRRRLTDLDD